MRTRKSLLGVILIAVMLSVTFLYGHAERGINKDGLKRIGERFLEEQKRLQPPLYFELLQSTHPAQQVLNLDPDIQLMFIDARGVPRFYMVNNLNAAKTISTDRVWPGGGAGYNLTGANTLLSQFAIWDGGGVLTSHDEFATNRVYQQDSPSGTSGHSTHVAGTLVAKGIYAPAKGMSYSSKLSAYEWTNDTNEMASAAASGLQISNHSYGYAAGWSLNGSTWYWYGDVSISPIEDYGFGFYGPTARDWDEVAYDAPEYLIVKSAGNDRDDAGPGPGGGHYYWSGTGWTWSTDTRDPDGGTTGYDCISWFGNAKNILCVGSVHDIPGGYTNPGDVVLSGFSSWGPADDGRIKPDIVANGESLTSSYNSGTSSYATGSGTSMSSPNAAGSTNLLYRHFNNTHSFYPRSATMKGIILHTADEAGSSNGPDYQHGWGLMNTESAAHIIANDTITGIDYIQEATLTNSTMHTYYFVLAAPTDVRTTICWTDPEGTVPPAAVDPITPILVNDLDLRVDYMDMPTTYYPWRLDRSNPANAATQADNTVDNVEVIDIESAPAGLYMITVAHKGTLNSGSQDYSLICDENILLSPPNPPLCWLEADTLDFGPVAVNDSLDLIVRVANVGGDTITLNPFSPPPFSIPEGTWPLGLGQEDTVSLMVRFKPDSVKLYENWLELNAPECNDVWLMGEGDPGTGISMMPHVKFTLLQNYPNPFAQSTSIRFMLNEAGETTLRIYDISGRLVRTLVNQPLQPGPYAREWDGRNDKGKAVASGIYFYRLKSGNQVMTRKAVFLR